MNAAQLRMDIVRPALEAIGLYSAAAENLVMGTAAQESRLEYVRQINGPAMGLWQMEAATYYDHWQTYLVYHPELVEQVFRAIDVTDPPQAERLVWDVRLAAIMCRIDYRRVPEALPAFDDIWGLASYWKRHYNSALGAGHEQQFVNNYALVM